MKKLLSILLVAGAVALTSCGSGNKGTDEKEKKVNQDSLTTAKNEKRKQDTSLYFVKKILNASPVEVANFLGKPDNGINKSDDCDYLPNCEEAFYQNGKYDVLYYNNMLKSIYIKNVNGLRYNEDCIEYLNFPKINPTIKNEFNIGYKVEGLKNLQFQPPVEKQKFQELKDEDKNWEVGYIIIDVEVNYNKRF
jgi:hypothetical protein